MQIEKGKSIENCLLKRDHQHFSSMTNYWCAPAFCSEVSRSYNERRILKPQIRIFKIQITK